MSTLIFKIETVTDELPSKFETEDEIKTLLHLILETMNDLGSPCHIEMFQPKDDGSNKLSTNKKLFQRLENDINSGISYDEITNGEGEEFPYEAADKDLILKNISETLKEYDKYYDQKRIV